MVAVIQLAITVGASLGGFLFDASGYQATFAVSATILCASALLTYFGARSRQRQ
jgi:predicted MFS family arabinose efflux permease